MRLFKRVPKNDEMIKLTHKQIRFMLGKQFIFGLVVGFIIRELLIRW